MTRVYGPDSGGEPEGVLQEIMKNGREVSIHTPKMKRCVQQVQAKGKVDNAYAVCTTSVGYRNAVLPSHQREALRESRRLVAKQFGVTEFAPGCIGFSPTAKKWYGWSHRAVAGFGVGDKVKKGDVLVSAFPVGYEAKTADDAKAMALAFADAVS